MSTNRIPLFDYAKIMAAYLVIFAHLVPEPYSVVVFIYTFHMPLFFIVSGMLGAMHDRERIAKTTNQETENNSVLLCYNALLKYAKKLLLPVLTYTLIFVAVTLPLYQCGAFSLKADAGVAIGSTWCETLYAELVHNAIQMWHSGKMSAVTMWFLFALFYCYMFNSLARISKNISLLVWISVALVTAYSSVYGMLPLYISQGCLAYIFYYIGKLLGGTVSTNIMLAATTKKNLRLVIRFVVATIVTVAIAAINGPVSMRALIYGDVMQPYNMLVFIVGGVAGTMMLLYFSALLPQYKKVSVFGNALMDIMGLQFIFIYMYKYVIGYNQGIMLSSIAALVIMLLCCLPKLLKR